MARFRDPVARFRDAFGVRVRPFTVAAALSSCRCSDPIMRPSDSAERSSSDCSRRNRLVTFTVCARDLRAPARLAMPPPSTTRWSKPQANLIRLRIEGQ